MACVQCSVAYIIIYIIYRREEEYVYIYIYVVDARFLLTNCVYEYYG